MRALLLAVSLIVPTLSAPARAAAPPKAPDAVPFFMTGQALWEPCNWPTDDAAATAACVLYVVGVVDSLNLLPETRICIALSADKLQVAGVVKEWLKNHPERRGDPAARLIRVAMTEAYPCQ